MSEPTESEQEIAPEGSTPKAAATDWLKLSKKITEYLSAGGLFNPEMMEHDKVRDLLIEIREAIDRSRSPQPEKQEMWTRNKVKEILDCSPLPPDAAISRLIHAHNSTLAQQQKRTCG